MQKKLHRLILITMLALVTTGGSFLVSSAESEIIKVGGHNLTYHAEEPATCENPGKKEHWHCINENCKRDYTVANGKATQIKDLTIPALGHEAGDPVEESLIEATCSEAGSYDKVVYCTRCSAEISRETVAIEPNDQHDWGDWTDSEDKGIEIRICKNDASHIETREKEEPEDPEDPEEPGAPVDPDNPVDPDKPVEPDKPADPVKPQIDPTKEEVAVVTPKYVTVEGPNGSMNAIVDNKGNATLKDFFMPLKKGSNQEEQLTMTVGGKTYNVTRYADGKVIGLPSGYTASGRDLKISGLKGDLDIRVSEQGILGGGVYSEPYVVRTNDGGLLSLDGSYYEPPASSTGSTYRSVRNTGTVRSNNTDNSANSIRSYAESMLTSLTENNTDNAADAAADVDDTPSASSFFKANPNGSTGRGLVLSESSDGAPSKMVIAVDIALISALIIGIGVLWKLGLLKLFRR